MNNLSIGLSVKTLSPCDGFFKEGEHGTVRELTTDGAWIDFPGNGVWYAHASNLEVVALALKPGEWFKDTSGEVVQFIENDGSYHWPIRARYKNGVIGAWALREVASVELPPKLAPQTKAVLDVLLTRGTITGVEASAILKVRSLSRRICDLIDAGYHITKEMKRDQTGQRYVRYSLA